MWKPCRYDQAETGHVEWIHFDCDGETYTCYHHARTNGLAMVQSGWARVTEDEWLPEPSRLIDASAKS